MTESIINRSGVTGAVLQAALLLCNSFISESCSAFKIVKVFPCQRRMSQKAETSTDCSPKLPQGPPDQCSVEFLYPTTTWIDQCWTGWGGRF